MRPCRAQRAPEAFSEVGEQGVVVGEGEVELCSHRIEENLGLQEFEQDSAAAKSIRALPPGVVPDGIAGKGDLSQGTQAENLGDLALGGQDRRENFAEPPAQRMQVIVDAGCGENVECGKRRSTGNRVPSGGRCRPKIRGFLQSGFIDDFHDGLGSPEGADGKTAAERLAVGGEVGLNAEIFGRAPWCEAEAGDYFVEDEDDAVAAGDGAKSFEKSRQWSEAAMDGFDDHRRQLMGVPGDDDLRGGQVVEGRGQDSGRDPVGAGSGGVGALAVRGGAAEHGGDADGVLTVVGACELEHLGTAGGCGGDTEAHEGGLGSGGDEPEPLEEGGEGMEAIREFDRTAVDGGEVDA